MKLKYKARPRQHEADAQVLQAQSPDEIKTNAQISILNNMEMFMKRKILLILLLLCTIFNMNSILAMSNSQYTVADILSLENVDIKGIGLRKSTADNQSIQDCKIEELYLSS